MPPKFTPISPPILIVVGDGSAGESREMIPVYGWWSADEWEHIHPVVANPGGPGIGPWRQYYGEDPWFAD